MASGRNIPGQKTIIVTGASGNLGKAVTQLLLNHNCLVFATVTSAASAKNLPDDPRLRIEIADLTNADQAARFVAHVHNTAGRIDAALLLAGGFAAGDIFTTTIEDIQGQISLNFETAYNVAKPVFAQLVKQNSGRIVFIASRPALNAADGKRMIAYGLSKSMLIKISEYLNEEAKGKNITTSVIALSTLDTPVNRSAMPAANPDTWVSPDSLAGIIYFLISDEAASMKETILKVYNQA